VCRRIENRCCSYSLGEIPMLPASESRRIGPQKPRERAPGEWSDALLRSPSFCLVASSMSCLGPVGSWRESRQAIAS
jgi:hypothetical protein